MQQFFKLVSWFTKVGAGSTSKYPLQLLKVRLYRSIQCSLNADLFLVAVETELYDLLGVSPDATSGTSSSCPLADTGLISHVDEIKKAYKKKVLSQPLELIDLY